MLTARIIHWIPPGQGFAQLGSNRKKEVYSDCWMTFRNGSHSHCLRAATLACIFIDMKFFSPATPLVLYSLLSPDACASRLERAIDPVRFSIFSFSGYGGVKQFLGSITGRRLEIFQRGYRNVPPVLSGELLAHGTGTRIEGKFDLEVTSKIAISLMSLLMIAVLAPVVLYALREHTVPRWIAISFALVFFLVAILIPRITRMNGFDQERAITDFLCETLDAGADPTAFLDTNPPTAAKK
jgi:hypothetical protein